MTLSATHSPRGKKDLKSSQGALQADWVGTNAGRESGHFGVRGVGMSSSANKLHKCVRAQTAVGVRN